MIAALIDHRLRRVGKWT